MKNEATTTGGHITDGRKITYPNQENPSDNEIIKELVEILDRHEREIAENRQRISELTFRTSHV